MGCPMCPMNALRRPNIPSLLLASLLAVALGACDDDKKAPQDAGVVDSGPSKPILGGKLGAAVAAAESAHATPPNASAQPDGPPQNGVFGPGGADKAHAASLPATIEVMDQGAEPRAVLALSPGEEQRSSVSTSLRLGAQGGVLNIDYVLSIKVDKPKADKGKKEEKKNEAEPAKPMSILAKVTSATPSGQAPKDAAEQLGKLKGSEIRYQLTPEAPIRVLAETLSLVTIPLPKKPVGKGAYWMATDRATTFGIEVVRYRVVRVENVDGDKVSFSIDVRQYAAKDEADLGGATKGAKVGAFESKGSGKSEWSKTGFLPASGATGVSLGAKLAMPGGGQQRMMLMQTQIDAKVGPAGDAPKAGAK
jgi:hypothetical protein